MPSRPGRRDQEEAAARWDRRIARAHLLADTYPASAYLLTFYASLAERQKALAEQAVADEGVSPPAGDAAKGSDPLLGPDDLDLALTAIPGFLRWLQHEAVAPVSLAEAAAGLRDLDMVEWQRILRSRISAPIARPETPTPASVLFVAEAVLQPLAERSAHRRQRASQVARGAADGFVPPAAPEFVPGTEPEGPIDAESLMAATPSRATTSEGRTVNLALSACRWCGDQPLVGVLREEGHGARRALVCARCLIARDYLRVVCPACGEETFDALPIYTAEQFAHVRIDACDTCKHYLKTIDGTKDGLADPVVDDLASVALDLWAREQGYVRTRQNLLRT